MKPLSLFKAETTEMLAPEQSIIVIPEAVALYRHPSENVMRTRMPLATSEPSIWTSLFELQNTQELDLRYRLFRIDNLPISDDRDRLLNKLAKTINYTLRQPVVLLRRTEGDYLAVPQAAPTLETSEFGIGPHIAHLVSAAADISLNLNALASEEETAIAVKFLEAAFRAPLMKRSDLWRAGGNGFYTKKARNAADQTEVDLYPGFVYSITAEDGRLFLSVDVNIRCIDRKSLSERIVQDDCLDFKRKHCLYQLGNHWYMVQFWGMTGSSVQVQRFRRESEEASWDIFTYTQEACKKQVGNGVLPAWIANLDPDGAAITYRYPGNEVERYGALALCRLSRSTNDHNVARLHRTLIFDPTKRMELAKKMIGNYFQHSTLDNQELQIAKEPFRAPRRVFAIPDQVFGNNQILRVAAEVRDAGHPALMRQGLLKQTTTQGENVETVPLKQMGRRRLELLNDSTIGPLTRSPFDPQYLLVPMSLDRETSEEFESRFLPTMRRTSGNPSYAMTRLLYDDRGANTLEKQVQAIRQALSKNGARSGYALLILPPRARPQLHDMLKAELWPDFQFQCVSAYSLVRYYESPGNVRRDCVSKLNSYVQNCALGLLVVNRKWGWALANPLHYEAYIGLDVLNQTAGFTFVFNGARQIYFRDRTCKQKERLLAKEIQKTLVDNLADHFQELELRPKSIVLHRDGRTFESEKKGFVAAIRDLISRNLLDSDVRVGIVDIRKTSSDAIRLYDGDREDALQNPQVGTYRIRSAHEGLVCTTGEPFRFPGTAKPLAATITEGDLNIEWVLEDIFALSLGVFTAPDKCARLPLTIKIADDLLEPIAAYIEDESELDDDEEEAEIEETWMGKS